MKSEFKLKKPASHSEKQGVRLADVERMALVRLISCGTALSNVAHNIRHDPAARKWKQACQYWQREWDNALNVAQITIYKLRADSRRPMGLPVLEKSK